MKYLNWSSSSKYCWTTAFPASLIPVFFRFSNSLLRIYVLRTSALNWKKVNFKVSQTNGIESTMCRTWRLVKLVDYCQYWVFRLHEVLSAPLLCQYLKRYLFSLPGLSLSRFSCNDIQRPHYLEKNISVYAHYTLCAHCRLYFIYWLYQLNSNFPLHKNSTFYGESSIQRRL